jgi:hypothetical protein
MSVNGALVEDKMRRFKGECAHFRFKKCPIYTHDGASAKFSTNSHETDYSVDLNPPGDSDARMSRRRIYFALYNVPYSTGIKFPVSVPCKPIIAINCMNNKFSLSLYG